MGDLMRPDSLTETDVCDAATDTDEGYPIAILSRGRRAKASTTCRIVDDIDDDAYISFMNDIY